MDAYRYFSLDTADPHALLSAILHSSCVPARAPDRVAVNSKRVNPIPPDWRDIADTMRTAGAVDWVAENLRVSCSVRLRTLLLPRRETAPLGRVPLEDIISMLRGGPDTHGFAIDLEGYGEMKFGKWTLGWCMVLKGGCLETNLVSPRWLDHGPWLVRRYDDLAVVFFHELDVDLETKAEQARPGHAAMVGAEGGYVAGFATYRMPPDASYVVEERRLEVPVYGREVPLLEMRHARWIVLAQGLGPDKPLERVTYSFADPAEAGPHLHDMWLRGIEVVTFVGGERTVLTDEYDAPPPAPPEWTERLAARLDAEGL